MPQHGQSSSIFEKRLFGTLPDGREVYLYVLRNLRGSEVSITDYGAIITALKMPDRDGKLSDVVLGFNSLENYLSPEYLKAMPFFGGIIGRFANRISGAKFSIGDETFSLPANNKPNTLHGGEIGFHQILWREEKTETIPGEDVCVEFSYLSHDGEQGFPGNLNVRVRYFLTENNELKIKYRATTDRDTIINLTSHSYFNLAGSGDCMNHVLQINANYYTPVDGNLTPTGELREVAGTPFDFREPKRIGEDLAADDEQIKFGKGYDHNFVLRGENKTMKLAATVFEQHTGRRMKVLTTEPGVQFYSGNFLDGTLTGKNGFPYERYSGFCLETQHFPDSPNKPHFPSTLLKTGKIFESSTVYKFSVVPDGK